MLHRGTREAAARSAFTLMEMLVVVAILVVLAGAGGVIYMKYLDDAKIDTAKIKVKELGSAVEAYNTRHPQDPAQSLEDLVKAGNLEQSGIIDPWGRPFMLDPSGKNHNGLKPDVYSQGPDGNSPIGNW